MRFLHILPGNMYFYLCGMCHQGLGERCSLMHCGATRIGFAEVIELVGPGVL
jgi:hypothetical protein